MSRRRRILRQTIAALALTTALQATAGCTKHLYVAVPIPVDGSLAETAADRDDINAPEVSLDGGVATDADAIDSAGSPAIDAAVDGLSDDSSDQHG